MPFPDVESEKTRPVVVLTEPVGKYQTVLVAPAYSKIPFALLASDLAVRANFAAFGLLRPSVIRLHRITELPLIVLAERLGSVPLAERQKFKSVLRRMFVL